VALPVTRESALREETRPGHWDFVRASYREEILSIEGQVGGLLKLFEGLGVLENGLVVLTSDHGEELQDHGGFEHGHAMWQELLHVPLVIWGKAVKPGREATPVSLLDVAPTVLEAAGLAAPLREALPGRSLWANATRGRALAPVPMHAAGTLYGPRRRVRVEWPWKLSWAIEDDTTELFDLAADPLERRDLAAAEPERTAAMRAALDAHARASEAAGEGVDVELTPEVIEGLRSVGYVE
jgi:arylsulfatase A-like enzyme